MSPTAAPLQPGDTLPEAVRACGGVQSVKVAGASENYHRIHWDDDYARLEGLPRAIVNNGLILAWLEALVEDTYGPDVPIRRLRVRFRAPVLLDEEVRCGGTVANAISAEGTTCLELDLWVMDAAGELRAEGQAALDLPA
jgi:acyl dehydratase